MGLLVDGKWHDEWYDTNATKGEFIRKESQFRDSLGSEKFPAEKDRYHLYISYACPWASRALAFLKLKGLEDIVSYSVVDALMAENGWSFANHPEPLYGQKYLYEIYTKAKANYSGRVTVPVLWDKKNETIVNNESSEIIRMFNSAFNDITGNEDDYYPEALRKEINEINDYVYDRINNGVYKAGFATTQKVYDKHVVNLFDALDKIDQRLEVQRYLVGNQITEADIRLFVTLVRFDPVYVGHFKCNLRRIDDYKNLGPYVRDIYQYKSIRETVYMDHIKTHYYASHYMINPTRIVPKGPIIDFSAPHDRERF
jgi:putative glutathione S-transferase